jgi:hypothetical protein
LPPEHVGGIKHCLAVCDRNTDLSKVAEDSDALIIRFSSQAQVREAPIRATKSHNARCSRHRY